MVASADVADTEGDVIVRREGNAGIIRLNRPKAINALTLEMVRVIAAALDRFERDPGIALVLLEGAGERGLCAGGDIRGLYESSRVISNVSALIAFGRLRRITPAAPSRRMITSGSNDAPLIARPRSSCAPRSAA